MTLLKQPDQNEGLANISVNSGRRSGMDEGGTGNPAHDSGKHDSSRAPKYPISRSLLRTRPELMTLRVIQLEMPAARDSTNLDAHQG